MLNINVSLDCATQYNIKNTTLSTKEVQLNSTKWGVSFKRSKVLYCYAGPVYAECHYAEYTNTERHCC